VQWGALSPGAKAPGIKLKKQDGVVGLKLKTRWRTQKQDGGRFEDGGVAFA